MTERPSLLLASRPDAAAPDNTVPGASLRVLRVVVGALGCAVCVRWLVRGQIGMLWVDPPNRLAYPGLGWVPRPGAAAAYALVVLTGLAGAAVVVHRWERRALAALAVGLGWLDGLDAATYLNHHVLLVVLATYLAVAPTGRDVARSAVWGARLVVGAVYFWAGWAKLNGEWLAGRPLGLWLATRSPDLSAMAVPAAWAGVAFDLLVVAGLCWRRTRAVAFAAAIIFHAIVGWLFPIGVFPWLMLGAATVFFAPDWPKRFNLSLLRVGEPRDWVRHGGRPLAAALVLAAVILPARAALPGADPTWSGSGDLLAWRVMVDDRAGFVEWRVRDRASGREWRERPDEQLSRLQVRALAATPALLPPAARAVRKHWQEQGVAVEVRADVFVSLNGRPPARLVRPDVDLAREGWSWTRPRWVLPRGSTAISP